MDGENDTSPFGAKGCGVLIASLVLAYVLLNLGIVGGFELARSMQWLIISNSSDQDLKLVGTILSGLLSPILLIAVTRLVLKGYFPETKSADLFKTFGFQNAVSTRQLLLSFVVGISIILFFKKYLMDAFPPGPSVGQAPSAIVSNANFWLQLIYAINLVSLVPVAEEFVFRGVLYKGFAVSWNKLISAVVVTVLFTLAHIDALRAGYWITQLALLSIPIVFVLAREITGSLYSPIMIHSGFNFGSVFIT